MEQTVVQPTWGPEGSGFRKRKKGAGPGAGARGLLVLATPGLGWGPGTAWGRGWAGLGGAERSWAERLPCARLGWCVLPAGASEVCGVTPPRARIGVC